MATFGYARVSTAQSKSRKVQHVDNQVQRLIGDGVPEGNIKVDDGVSGKLRSRPAWDQLLPLLREGDVLTVTKLDRIGRSLVNTVDVVNMLRERGVQLKVLDQGIDTTTPAGRFFFHIIAALAELEAELISERTIEGLAAAKVRRGGELPTRGPSISREKIETAEMLARTQPKMSAERIAEVIGVSRATLYRHVDLAAIRDGSPADGR